MYDTSVSSERYAREHSTLSQACGCGIANYNKYCIIVVFTAEVLNQDTWNLLKELEDPELKRLAAKLPDTILHSRADSTVTKHLGAFKRWRAWARELGMPVLPTKECRVALYL